MSRSPKWSLAALLGAAAIVFTACSGSATTAPTAAPATPAPATAAPATPAPATPAPATAAPATPAPATPAPATAAPATPAPATPAAFAPTSYPATAIDCANKPAGYTGEFSQIKAIDQYTVEFDLCQADVAFLSKIAFDSNDIQDSEWLAAHAPDKSYVQTTNGTGPYLVKEWVTGDHVTLEANPNYWGEAPKTKTVIVKWSTEAAQRLQELQAGAADGIDNLGTDDFAAVSADTSLTLYPRQALNILYLGFNVDQAPWNNEKVRQALAMGVDRKRIADNYYPAGSEAAKYFTPCAIPAACGGTEWYGVDIAQAKQLLKDANFDFSKEYEFHYRTKVRSYLPSPTQVATDIQSQLKDNLGINIKLVVEKDDTYLTDSSKGKFGLFLLGWGADYPDVTDFLDYHFGTGANAAFGKQFSDITALLTQGGSEPDVTKRATIYGQANDLIRQHVPMIPLVHGGSATAFKADVAGAHSSPIGDERFNVMTAGTRDQLVWVQGSEPSGLYCGDESDGDALRICDQIFNALYAFKTGGLDVEPALATSCDPSADLKTWTCKLRQGVKFGVSGELDANDVVLSFAVQWDAKHPLHVGNGGTFDYFPALFGGFLNPPAQ